MLNRTWKICSNQESRDDEIIKIREILKNNEYPEKVIDREIAKFLKSQNINQTTDSLQSNEADKSKRFIILPYVNDRVEQYGKRLTRLINNFYPKVDFKVAFKAPKELGHFFRFKDKPTDILKQSLVLYHIKCKDCDADYIGKTERILHYRVREHKGESSSNVDSAIHQHHIQTQHKIDFDNIKIIDRADNDIKLQYKEILHIDKRKPILNKQLNSNDSYRINTYIIGSKKKL